MSSVLQANRNCYPLARAGRFALLVDGSNYYRTLAESIARARHIVAIVGWDLDSRVQLGPGAGVEPPLPPLRDFLPAMAEQNPDLNIYILGWDFPVLFANVRDPKLVLGQDPFNHPRVHLKFDSTHPPGASHHQKIVVVDDCLAFAGGMDIAGGRWDSPEHRACDPRRPGEDGPYPPSHDVQAMVDGEAARALARIVRERWYRATGTAIPQAGQTRDCWPDHIIPDLVDVGVGISRTDAGSAPSGGGCREIEQLHLDLFAAARRFIYIENQYLTSATMVTALCRRLDEADGPEVVIVLPLNNSGWLEDHTIEVLRVASVRRLRQADRFGRLRICYPVVPDLGEQSIAVHSKVLIVDDRLLRVGSSNLTNRSMRLDTECDLTIEAAGPEQQSGIARLRNCLLGEHLDMTAEAVAAALATDASLVRLVDARSSGSRCLRDLPSEDRSSEQILGDELVDPSGPMTPGLVIEGLAATVIDRPVRRLLPLALIGAGLAVAGLAAWRLVRARSLPPTPQRAGGPKRPGSVRRCAPSNPAP
jgi:phospholipase D1/2